MGSVAAKSVVNDKITSFLPYICTSTKDNLTVNSSVELEVKPSELVSEFIPGRHEGLFTKHALKKGDVICEPDDKISVKMNDGMINLEPVLRAKNSVDLYKALTDMKNSYYDLNKAESVVNVIMVGAANGTFYQTIKDVNAGGELIRVYGFTTWTLELFDILSNHNVAGFAKFISELKDNLEGDPYQIKVSNLDKIIRAINPDVYKMTLEQYDQITQSIPFKLVGKDVEQGYVLLTGFSSLFQEAS